MDMGLIKAFGRQLATETNEREQRQAELWKDDVNLEDINAASNKNGSTDNVFDADELSAFLSDLGIDDFRDVEAFKTSILAGRTTISAEELMQILDTNPDGTINKEEFDAKLAENNIVI